MNKNTQSSENLYLSKGGKTTKLIARKVWAKHKLGQPKDWPIGLNLALRSCLKSVSPTALCWGSDKFIFFNDSWFPFADKSVPESLGDPAGKVWKKDWSLLLEATEKVLKEHKGLWMEGVYLPFINHAQKEERYFNFALDPIYDNSTRPAGVLITGHDVTPQVLAKRRNILFRELTKKTFTAESPDATCIFIANTLSELPSDIPFGLFYLLNTDKNTLRLAASSIDEDQNASLSSVKISSQTTPFSINKAIKTGQMQVVDVRKYKLVGGQWEDYCKLAVSIPLYKPAAKELLGIMVLGISPRLEFDKNYESFFAQVGELVSVGVSLAYDSRLKLIIQAREHEVQEQLKAALSSGAIGIWSWDIETDTLVVDDHLASMLAIPPSKANMGLPLESFLERIHAHDKQRVQKQIYKAVESKKVFQEEYRILLPRGRTKWVLARGRVEVNSANLAVRFPGVVIDINDHKVLEAKLVRSERMFSALFRSSIIGVAVVTGSGGIEEANKTFLEMFGYTQKDLKEGLNAGMLAINPAGESSLGILGDLPERGEIKSTERTLKRKNGGVLPVLFGAVHIKDTHDKYIMFVLDISEQIHLREMNEAKDDFISIASHQLRTPATGVKQYLGMLLEGYVGNLQAEHKAIIKTAFDSNERQLTIVNDLLKVAQADAKEVRLKKEWVDVISLLDDILQEQSHKFGLKQQNVKFIHHKKELLVCVDPFYMRTVFENVIDNAYKYTSVAKTIEIKASNTAKNVVIKVKDEGVGIRERDLPKLFKKFSRIDNPLSTIAGGTGLGLYWVRQILQLHGGDISVITQENIGSTFVIKVPIV